MNKNVKKYERETLRETFYAIQDAVPNKKAHYDGRKIKWDSYTFEDFASHVIEVLKDDEEKRKKFYKLKTNVKKIHMFVKDSRNAFMLTQKLPDKYIVEKEMLYVIEGGVFSGSLIKLG